MKKNKNIAFICEGLSYEYGGQAVSIPSLGNALAKNSNVNYFVTESETDRISIIDKSSRVFFCKAFGKKIKFSPMLFLLLFKQRKNIDIVHINNLWNFVPLMTSIFCYFFKKPYVVSTRGMAMQQSIMRNKKKYIFFILFLKNFLTNAKFIHITSNDEKINLINLNIKNEYIFAPNGVEETIKNISFNKLVNIRVNSKQVLFVGKICEHKNIDILINAFSLFIAEKVDWRLMIVGHIEDDRYLEKIKKIIKNKKLEKNVVIAGFKTGQYLIDEYKRASFFVSASKSENFGLSIAEALKSGLPCIVPKKSPWRDIAKNKCGFSSPPDEVKIAQYMIEICNDYVDNKEVFYNCIELTKPYSWKSQAEILLNGYNK